MRNLRPPTPTPLLYAIHHTISVMAISCLGQGTIHSAQCAPWPILPKSLEEIPEGAAD